MVADVETVAVLTGILLVKPPRREPVGRDSPAHEGVSSVGEAQGTAGGRKVDEFGVKSGGTSIRDAGVKASNLSKIFGGGNVSEVAEDPRNPHQTDALQFSCAGKDEGIIRFTGSIAMQAGVELEVDVRRIRWPRSRCDLFELSSAVNP